MNRELQKVMKIAMIVFAIAIFVFSFIVSQDSHHLETCHKDHCIYCAMIHIAQNTVSLFIAFIVAIILGVFIYLFLSRLRKELKKIVQSSLVFQNVQLNE